MIERMKKQDKINKLLYPNSVAIIGCSEHNSGGTVLQNLIYNQYQGAIYPVHPKKEEVFGYKCYKKLADIKHPVDLCFISLRNDLVPSTLDEMAALGISAAVIIASGYSETGFDGVKREQLLAEKLKTHEILACGPNCLGFINLHHSATLYSADTDINASKGSIGFVSHSGSVCIAFASACRGAGFSFLVSSGNEASLDVADYFRAMVEDDNTEIIVGFLETIRDPEALKKVAKLAFEKNKPIIILKVGKCDIAQQTAAAHSGALAGSAEVASTFFRQNNILEVNSLDEVLETCELFLHLKNAKDPNKDMIAMTAISGGQLGFCSDIAQDVGLKFGQISDSTKSRIAGVLPGFATAKNPLDVTTALFEPEQYKECLRALADDENVNVLVLCQDAEKSMYTKQIDRYRGIIQAVCEVKSEITKPIVVFSPIKAGLVQEFYEQLSKAGIPLLQGASESLNAVRLYFEWVRMKKNTSKISGRYGSDKNVDLGSGAILSERESKAVLRAYEFDVAKDILVHNQDEAVIAAELIGYPVALKVDSPDIPHKTEAGVIRLDVCSAEGVTVAYSEILANAASFDESARIYGVSVQEMVEPGIEMMLGGKNDPTFGPVVIVGIGGIFVEVLKDISLAIAPISHEYAREMIGKLKGKEMLYGARGSNEADVDALADAIVKLSYLITDLGENIQEIDINPLIVFEKGKGVKAVDALIYQKI